MSSSISLMNKGKKWSYEEDYQLKQEYTIQELNIVEIAKIHQRTVGSIISRLKSTEVLSPFLQPEEYFTVRGYNEYLQDTEFKEAEKISRNKKEKEHPTLLNSNINSEISEIKRDIVEMKNSIREILTLLNSIYEFEEE